MFLYFLNFNCSNTSFAMLTANCQINGSKWLECKLCRYVLSI